MNLKITLNRVKCIQTEDTSGADDFYIVGAAGAGKKTQAVLTTPVKIDDGQELAFPPDQRVVFDGAVADTDTLRLGLTAYDQDMKRDWGKRGDAIKKITAAVSALPAPSGALLASTAFTAVNAVLGGIVRDDKLGQLVLNVPVKDLKPGADKKWRLGEESNAISSGRYEVYYTVEKA